MTHGRIHAHWHHASFARSIALAATLSCLLLGAQDASGRGLGGRPSLRSAPSAARVASLIEGAEQPTASGEGGTGQLGYSLALSGDGSTALVGAPADEGFAGAAWVFTRTGSVWTQQGPKLSVNEATDLAEEAQCAKEANECGFGRSVALSADGNTALIGAPRANDAQGAAWAFTRSGSTWSQFGEKLIAGEPARGNGSFGRGVALSADGETALVGAPRDSGGRGGAWAFARTSAGFSAEAGKLTGAGEIGVGYFGRSLALSGEGTTALIGAPGDDGYRGAVWPFARSGASWASAGEKLVGGSEELGGGRFGFSVALSADGDTGLVGARSDNDGIGAAWALTRSGSSWSQQGPKLTAAGEVGEGEFGYSTALSGDGNSALIGAPHDSFPAGAAFTFTRAGASWTQQDALRAVGVEPQRMFFGTGLALASDASTALIGAPREGRKLGGVWAYFGQPGELILLPPPSEEGPPPSKETTNGPGDNTVTGSGAPQGGVLGSTASALPPPVLAVSGNVVRLAGTVRVKLPGARSFVLLTAGAQIPFGSIVDATHGRVSVTTATPQGATQTMVFYQGEFRLTQRRDGLVVSTLLGGGYAKCRTAHAKAGGAQASTSHGKRVVRKLWAEGHGKYSTKGSYATGAVLGTRWLTEDLCEGTVIRVLSDRVAVTNLVNGKHVTVIAGHSYLAKAPHRRAH